MMSTPVSGTGLGSTRVIAITTAGTISRHNPSRRRGHQVQRRRPPTVNPHTKDHDLQVDVKQSVVILTGKVSSAVAKRAAGDDCWDTAGVVDVSNQLIVAVGS